MLHRKHNTYGDNFVSCFVVRNQIQVSVRTWVNRLHMETADQNVSFGARSVGARLFVRAKRAKNCFEHFYKVPPSIHQVSRKVSQRKPWHLPFGETSSNSRRKRVGCRYLEINACWRLKISTLKPTVGKCARFDQGSESLSKLKNSFVAGQWLWIQILKVPVSLKYLRVGVHHAVSRRDDSKVCELNKRPYQVICFHRVDILRSQIGLDVRPTSTFL